MIRVFEINVHLVVRLRQECRENMPFEVDYELEKIFLSQTDYDGKSINRY